MTDDIISLRGHEAAEQTFLTAYNSSRLHHGWLITGPRGIGKATLAHKIARFLLHNPPEDNEGLFGASLENNPVKALNTDPQSDINKVIAAGGHGNILLIERSLNDKGRLRDQIVISDVQKLQNFFGKTSFDGGWRIVIIDSADEMNRNGANALLKTLEEPPKNALLILLAHAPGKLLPTIKSRCRQLRLSPLSQEIITEILARKFPDLEADEINAYAGLCEGSPGYAIRLVETHGLALYGKILDILSSLPDLDVPQAHKLATSLSLKKAGQEYALFGELLTAFISRMIRHVAALNGGKASPVREVLNGECDLMVRLGQRIELDQWAELWEKICHKMDQINLDRKQVILNILTQMNQKTH